MVSQFEDGICVHQRVCLSEAAPYRNPRVQCRLQRTAAASNPRLPYADGCFSWQLCGLAGHPSLKGAAPQIPRQRCAALDPRQRSGVGSGWVYRLIGYIWHIIIFCFRVLTRGTLYFCNGLTTSVFN